MIGKKIIETASRLDESLAEILKVEVNRLKQLIKNKSSNDELLKTNTLIKNIIMALTVTEEKIKIGMDLYMENTKNEH